MLCIHQQPAELVFSEQLLYDSSRTTHERLFSLISLSPGPVDLVVNENDFRQIYHTPFSQLGRSSKVKSIVLFMMKPLIPLETHK